MRVVAGVKRRFHDIRHTPASKMAENHTPEEIMKALLSHMNKKMIERHSHIRADVKREAVAGPPLAKPIHVTPEASDGKNGVPKVSPKVKSFPKSKAI